MLLSFRHQWNEKCCRYNEPNMSVDVSRHCFILEVRRQKLVTQIFHYIIMDGIFITTYFKTPVRKIYFLKF